MGRFSTLFFAAIGLVVIVGLVQPCAALAQSPAGLLLAALTASGEQLPPAVSRVGNVGIATVGFDNHALFTVTGPVVRKGQNLRTLCPPTFASLRFKGTCNRS